jgi:hypothetical protein
VFYGTLTATFAALFLWITARQLWEGEWTSAAFAAALTGGLLWQVARWRRRFREVGSRAAELSSLLARDAGQQAAVIWERPAAKDRDRGLRFVAADGGSKRRG